MSQHFSLRFQAPTFERLKRRAQTSGTPARTLAQRYVEEGLRQDEHPLIHFVEGPAGRRAAVLGTGLDVWEIVATIRDNDGDPAAAAEYLQVPAHLIGAAVTYYGAFREEIDQWIADTEEESEQAHAAWQAGRDALRA